MIELYPFQHDAVAKIEASTAQRILVVAPTRAGKTIIVSELIRRRQLLNAKACTLFLVHRRELLHQAVAKLSAFGIEAGTILAGEPTDPTAHTQVAAVQTLTARTRRGSMQFPPADLVVLDECHHATAPTWRAVIARYPKAIILGVTATPCRSDGRGLGGIFEEMIECPQVAELIDNKHLVPTRVYAPNVPDLKGVHTKAGDYALDELAERMDRIGLIGDIVTHWHRLAERRSTVIFATSVAHSIHICEALAKSGVKAAHIDGKTPKDERDETLRQLTAGEIEVVCNCQLLTEGYDLPALGCVVLARPTKSMGLFRQMVGRVLTPAPGKTFALVLDHAGAVFRHGFIEEPVTWTLDPDKRPVAPIQDRRGQAQHTSHHLVTCKQCSAVRTAGKPCPQCGYMPRRPGQDVETHEGELERLDHRGRIHPSGYTPAQRLQWHQMLTAIALQRRYKLGWAAHKYKEKFGHWPVTNNVTPIPPNAEVIAWERHCRIKFAKAMQKTAANG